MLQGTHLKQALRLSLCAAAVVAANNTLAQSPQQPIEQIEVWGTEVRASSVRLADDEMAIKQADHISDLLRTIPGVDVGGAHSLNQRITIRSMDDKDLRISIDGANQNTYMYHHMGNLQIHADILQSVDIEIGTNSVIDGGLGGAVRFRTKEAKELLQPGQEFGGRVQAGYGDNAGQSYALTGFGQLTESLDLLLYYNHIDRDNYEVGGGKIKDAQGNQIAGTDGEVRGLEGELDDALLKFGWDLAPGQRLELGYETYTDEGDYSYRPDMGLATDLAISESLGLPLTYDTEFTRDTLTLNYQLDWGRANSLNAALFRNESNLWRDESANQAVWPADPGLVEGEAINTGLNILASSRLEGPLEHRLTYGLELIRYETEYRGDGVKRSGEEAVNRALFIEDRIALTESLSLTPGLRYDSYSIESVVVDDDFNRATGALALEYAFSDALLFKLSATQLFKGPEIGEVFVGAGIYDKANPEIDAETGLNTQVALAFEDAVFGAERFTAGVTLFQTDIDDYIYDYAPPPPSVGGRSWKDNVGDLRIDGFEAYLGYDINGFSALLTYSVAESELDAFAGYAGLDSARIDRQQGDTLSFNLDYSVPALNLTLHWDVLLVDDVSAGKDLDGASKNNAKDGFHVHNISVRWAPGGPGKLALTLGVDNLFDEYYASQSSRTGLSAHPLFGDLYLLDYEPGRNVKATVSYQF